MTDPKRLIHWEHTPAGVCTRRDSDADATSVTQDNGTTITSTARATHAANVTCPTCQGTKEFTEAKAAQDEYWAQEEREAEEWFAWVDSEEGQAWEKSLDQ